MNNNFINFNLTKNKTIKEVKQFKHYSDIFVFFTDGTWSIISSDYDRDEYDEISSRPRILVNIPELHCDYERYNIMNYSEVKEIQDRINKERKNKDKEYRYKQYLKLKQEFDPDLGRGI